MTDEQLQRLAHVVAMHRERVDRIESLISRTLAEIRKCGVQAQQIERAVIHEYAERFPDQPGGESKEETPQPRLD